MSMTATDVVSVLGPIDEALLADIVATDATALELAEAWAWANSYEALVAEGHPLPTGKVAELLDLLTADEDEPEA